MQMIENCYQWEMPTIILKISTNIYYEASEWITLHLVKSVFMEYASID